MRAGSAAISLCIVAALTGCYHATVITGASPSTDTVSQPWASSWVYGLVPPKTVETAAKCPHGVARVETQLPFVNMLVGILTLGIYTPMSIVATCAARTGADADQPVPGEVSLTTTPEAARDAFMVAATLARATGEPVLLEVTD